MTSTDQITSEEQIDKVELLRQAPLFEGLRDEAIARLARLSRVAVYPEGDEIVEEGADFIEETDGMFMLVAGAVEVRKDSTDGTDGRLLMRLEGGEFFGEMSLLDGGNRSASVFAVKECQCLVLHRWDFLRELRKDPEIAEKMLVVLSARLRAMNEALGGRPE